MSRIRLVRGSTYGLVDGRDETIDVAATLFDTAGFDPAEPVTRPGLLTEPTSRMVTSWRDHHEVAMYCVSQNS